MRSTLTQRLQLRSGRRRSQSPVQQARVGRLLLWLFGPALFAVPWTSAQLTAGLDASWVTALNLAFLHRLRFGHDLLFTYGPLGFVDAAEPISRKTIVIGA